MLIKPLCLLSAGLLFGLNSTTVLAQMNNKVEKLPKNCQYLKEVATNQSHITKTIDSIIGKNFDTDFAVPTGIKFTSFKGFMVTQNDGTYGVTINLKYPDNSVSTAFRKDVVMQRYKSYSLPFQSPTKNIPYQINLNINGNTKNVYTI